MIYAYLRISRITVSGKHINLTLKPLIYCRMSEYIWNIYIAQKLQTLYLLVCADPKHLMLSGSGRRLLCKKSPCMLNGVQPTHSHKKDIVELYQIFANFVNVRPHHKWLRHGSPALFKREYIIKLEFGARLVSHKSHTGWRIGARCVHKMRSKMIWKFVCCVYVSNALNHPLNLSFICKSFYSIKTKICCWSGFGKQKSARITKVLAGHGNV